MTKRYPQFENFTYWTHVIEPLRPLNTVMTIDGSNDLEEAIKNLKKIIVQEYVIRKRTVIIRIVQAEILKVLFMALVNRGSVEYFDYRDEKEQS